MKIKFVFIGLFAPLLLLIIPTKLTIAEQAGIKVAPATVTMVIEKSDTEKVTWVGIKNNYSVPVKLTTELRGVEQEQGNLTPTKEVPEQLKNNLEIDKTNIELAAGESINVRLLVKDASKLLPGGNYASLVIKQSGEKGNAVGLQPAISVSIFITKLDGAFNDLKIENLKLNRFLLSMPSSVSTEFVNSGNVVVVPRGRIDVLDNKNTVTSGLINVQSTGLFPGNKLNLKTALKNKNIFELPGKKTLIINYRYDGSDQFKTITKTFIYLPIWLLLIPLLLIAVIIFYIKQKASKRQNKKVKSINIKEESETTIFKFK